MLFEHVDRPSLNICTNVCYALLSSQIYTVVYIHTYKYKFIVHCTPHTSHFMTQPKPHTITHTRRPNTHLILNDGPHSNTHKHFYTQECTNRAQLVCSRVKTKPKCFSGAESEAPHAAARNAAPSVPGGRRPVLSWWLRGADASDWLTWCTIYGTNDGSRLFS